MADTHDSRRHILLDGQVNFRNLGGYETGDGRSLKWGQVYRSGRLVKLTDENVAWLEQLGIRTVVNLLTEDDEEAYGRDRLPAGASEVSLPIDSDTATKLSNRTTAALKSVNYKIHCYLCNLRTKCRKPRHLLMFSKERRLK